MVDEAMRIRVIRAILGISKSEFAHLLDVHPNTASNWESGRNIPQGKPRRALAEICHQHNIAIRPDGFPVPEAE